MAAIKVGDIISITFQNRKVGSRRYGVKAGENVTLTQGHESTTGQQLGDGGKVFKAGSKSGGIKGLSLACDLTDYDYLINIVKDEESTEVSMEMINGTVVGKGRITGEGVEYAVTEGFVPVEIEFDDQYRVILNQ